MVEVSTRGHHGSDTYSRSRLFPSSVMSCIATNGMTSLTGVTDNSLRRDSMSVSEF